MALPTPFKLEKLKVHAYSSRKRGPADAIGTFEAMFNPSSFSQRFDVVYGKNQGFNSTGREVNYARSKPPDLEITLLLDGTGVHQYVRRGLRSVSDQVTEFLTLTFRMNGAIHEPNFLVVEWGDFRFSCRLGSTEVTYTSFGRDGKPLRAELEATFIADKEVKKRMATENKQSPDLTHVRTVRSGDTLPLLTQDVYGSSALYLRVAQANGLDDFRALTPGQQLFFPPLA